MSDTTHKRIITTVIWAFFAVTLYVPWFFVPWLFPLVVAFWIACACMGHHNLLSQRGRL